MTESHARTRRRLPTWLWVVAGVLLVAIATTVALLLGNRGGGPVPEAEVVTLPVPTPTVEAIEREPGTPFFDALPSAVLVFALSASEAAPDLVVAGALEGYQLTYTDGSAELVLQAGQWPTAAEADAAYADLVASAVPEGATPDAEGEVSADGSDVGTYTQVTNADGTVSVLWTNGTAVLQLDGPADAVPDVYEAFPL